MVDDLLELFRSQFAILAIIVGSFAAATMGFVHSSLYNEIDTFSVARLPQFDIQSVQFGSRSRRVHADASCRHAKERSRRCLIVHWTDFPRDYPSLIRDNVAAIVVIIPLQFDHFSDEDRAAFLEFESFLLSSSISVPVYFTVDSSLMHKIISVAEERSVGMSRGVMHAAYTIFLGKNYRLVTKNQQTTVVSHYSFENLMAKLAPENEMQIVPTVAIVAHYDTAGLTAVKSFGYDCNGSGVVLLLELLRFFSKFYRHSHTTPKYKLQFMLVGGGQLNYAGTKHLLDGLADERETSGKSMQLFDFAISLDGLIGHGERKLYVHVSKLQKETSPIGRFQKSLEKAAASFNLTVEIVQKKISVANDRLSWQHEAFNIRRFHALTLSGFSGPQNPMRRTVLDVQQPNAVEILLPKYMTIVNALLHYVYDANATSAMSFINETELKSHLQFWNLYLTKYPRHQQIMPKLDSNAFGAAVIRFVRHFAGKASVSTVHTDKRHPEFVLYEGAEDVMFANETSTALFDLLAAALIMVYLYVFYVAVVLISRYLWTGSWTNRYVVH